MVPIRTIILLATLGPVLACNRATPVTEPVAEPDPTPAMAPVDTETEAATPAPKRRERILAAPIEGIEHWADAPLTTEAFLAQARAAGIEVEHTVEVASLEQLLRALAPNTAIVLAPGRHVFEDSALLAEPEEQAKLPDWSALSPYYDGGEIHDLHDLVIVGAGPEPTVILQPDGYAHALSFRSVEDLGLHALTIGHRPQQGWCRGGVIKVVEGGNVLITDSTLFGSGTEGLSLVTVDGLRLQDSVITDCSEQFSTISQSREVVYERVRVVGNRADLLRGFAIYRSTVTLTNSVLADNKALGWRSRDSYGLLFAVDGSYDWGGLYVDEIRPLEPDRTRSEVMLHNTSVDGERHDGRL